MDLRMPNLACSYQSITIVVVVVVVAAAAAAAATTTTTTIYIQGKQKKIYP